MSELRKGFEEYVASVYPEKVDGDQSMDVECAFVAGALFTATTALQAKVTILTLGDIAQQAMKRGAAIVEEGMKRQQQQNQRN